MNKILITNNQPEQNQPATLVVRYEQAQDYLNCLRDAHFKECLVQYKGQYNPKNFKFLLYVARVLKEGGILTIDTTNISNYGQQSPEMAKLLQTLGFVDQQVDKDIVRVSKPGKIVTQTKTQTNNIPIGFHQQGAKVNQDDLLKGDVVEKKAVAQDCSVKPKACANCSCGRKQAEQAGKPAATKSKEELVREINEGKFKSNCGNCSLGDAFRCAGCPVKGLPAWKPGDKIVVDQVSDLGVESTGGQAKVQGGKVKLSLD